MSSTADPAVVDVASPAVPVRDAGLWLHGVVRDLDQVRLAGISGMDGGPVRAVRAPGLTAVVSTAPLAEYGEEALRRHLEDMSWLERAARAHHGVVDALFRMGAVVPARLATVYRDEDRIAAVLAERRLEFAAALDHVTGRVEWGVKGYVVPVAAVPVAAAPQPAGAGGAGAAYLRKRRAQLMALDEGQQAALQDGAVVHEALRSLAVAVRRHPPQDRRLSGADTAMVLNDAYLVEAARQQEFAGLVEALSGRHAAIRLELTGPWPPYSFTADEQAAKLAENPTDEEPGR